MSWSWCIPIQSSRLAKSVSQWMAVSLRASGGDLIINYTMPPWVRVWAVSHRHRWGNKVCSLSWILSFPCLSWLIALGCNTKSARAWPKTNWNSFLTISMQSLCFWRQDSYSVPIISCCYRSLNCTNVVTHAYFVPLVLLGRSHYSFGQCQFLSPAILYYR